MLVMREGRLPIGVVMPTLNARAHLPVHLAQLRTWADWVQEVIVVDSHSTDGTVEFIKAQLRHPGLRVFEHPPGLYESWNYGLRRVTAEYAYISTVGDTITLDGLQHLATVATELRSDVVVSRPEFLSTAGHSVRKRWPVHDLVDHQGITQPASVPPLQVFLLSLLDVPEGLLGSSASNLYRTRILQGFPFPTQYGHFGDTAWGIRYAFRSCLAVTPRIFSRFTIHPGGAMMNDDKKERLVGRLFELGQETLRAARKEGCCIPNAERLVSLLGVMPAKNHEVREHQDCYDRARDQFWPWILNPRAWHARIARNRERRRLRQAKEAIWRDFGLLSPPDHQLTAGQTRSRNV